MAREPQVGPHDRHAPAAAARAERRPASAARSKRRVVRTRTRRVRRRTAPKPVAAEPQPLAPRAPARRAVLRRVTTRRQHRQPRSRRTQAQRIGGDPSGGNAGCRSLVTAGSLYVGIVRKLPDPRTLAPAGRDQTTVILRPRTAWCSRSSSPSRTGPTSPSEIPARLRQAVDRHRGQAVLRARGVDPLGIARALFVDVTQGKRHGRLDHHAAVRQERLRTPREHAHSAR